MKKVVTTLKPLCAKFVDDREYASQLFRKDKMSVWAKAFTHISHNIENSYEVLEHVGDRVCDWTFKAYILQRFPDQTLIVYTYLINWKGYFKVT